MKFISIAQLDRFTLANRSLAFESYEDAVQFIESINVIDPDEGKTADDYITLVPIVEHVSAGSHAII